MDHWDYELLLEQGQDQYQFLVCTLVNHFVMGTILCKHFDWNSQNFNRTALLNFIISCNGQKYNTDYLEIGCQNNLNFNAICLKDKIGVDPDIGGNLRMTSDQFFNQNK